MIYKVYKNIKNNRVKTNYIIRGIQIVGIVPILILLQCPPPLHLSGGRYKISEGKKGRGGGGSPGNC